MPRLFHQRFTRKDSTTGEVVRHFSKKWYGEFRDEFGKLVRKPLSTDKSAAQSLLSDELRRVERRRAGLEDEFTRPGFKTISSRASGRPG